MSNVASDDAEVAVELQRMEAMCRADVTALLGQFPRWLRFVAWATGFDALLPVCMNAAWWKGATAAKGIRR